MTTSTQPSAQLSTQHSTQPKPGAARAIGIAIDWLLGRHGPPMMPTSPTIPRSADPGPIAMPTLRGEPVLGGPTPFESLDDAFRQVTAEFLRGYMRLLHAEDPSNYFRVDVICLHETEAARPYLKEFLRMPDNVGRRYVASLMGKVEGARDMLDLSRLSAVHALPAAEPVDGFARSVLLVFDGAEVPLTIEFIGEFAEREPLPEVAPPAPPKAPTITRPQAPQAAQTHQTPHAEAKTIDAYPDAATPIPVARALDDEPSADPFGPTPLASPPRIDKPLPVLMLTLRVQGQADRVFPVYEHDLPLPIGRFIGQAEAGLPADSFVSRTHLLLSQYHATKGLLVMEDRSSNGTWDRQGKTASRFSYVLGQGQWLSLGGQAHAPRTAQLRLVQP